MQHRPVNLLRPRLEPTAPTPPQPRRRIALYFFIFLLVLTGILWSIKRYAIWSPKTATGDEITLQPKQTGFLQSVKNFIFHSSNLVDGQNDDRINLLLLGMGGSGHDGPYLTDTNIILSIKPSTKEVAMVSVPRDLGVIVPGLGWRKINYINSLGEEKNPGQGGDYARQIFAKLFNQPIPYYIRVDFKAFEEIIDAVGGVTFTVPRGFVDTEFPGPQNSYQTAAFSPGLQTMNGKKALTYARSRHGNNGEGSDFARAHRQQLIIGALREKTLMATTYLNPIIVRKIIDSLSNHITTNLDFGQLIYLANLAKEFSGITKNVVLDNSPRGFLISTTGESGAFLLMPKTGSFDEINQTIAGIFTTSSCSTEISCANTTSAKTTMIATVSPSPPSRATKIELQNGTWRVGLASREKQRLEAKSLTVVGIGNSLLRPVTTTGIYMLSPNLPKDAINNLERLLQAPATATLPLWLKEEYDNPDTSEDERGMKYNNEADVLIILGNDFKEF